MLLSLLVFFFLLDYLCGRLVFLLCPLILLLLVLPKASITSEAFYYLLYFYYYLYSEDLTDLTSVLEGLALNPEALP
jgi:hypothetical protein|nr:MAG TPA: hypothetical protein [Bacteriophage sp.]